MFIFILNDFMIKVEMCSGKKSLSQLNQREKHGYYFRRDEEKDHAIYRALSNFFHFFIFKLL